MAAETHPLTTHAAAARLGLSKRRVQQFIKAGRLPAEKWGRDYLILPSDVDAFAAVERHAGRPIRRARGDASCPTCDLAALPADIRDLGLAVYTPLGLRWFLTTPLHVFDGHTALEEIAAGRAERVMGALAADYEGGGH